ncbi:MAG: hypothetical protein RB191_14935, partial [Terriglobia bacterium]|nr:hypothetical protein [Terriglobia bacterium]
VRCSDFPERVNPMRSKQSCGAFCLRRIFPVAMLLVAASTIFALQIPADGTQPFPDLPSVRGTVKSVHGSDAIIQTDDGQAYTVHTSDNTRIYKSRQPIKMSDIRAGDTLVAAGALDANARLLRAIFVADVDAATVAKMRADFGKTWIAGKVLKIEEARITVDRMDHKTQVIEADDTTSFRKDGQSVTLLDVHVGDGIRATGAIKNDIFVPTQLTVIDPAYRRHRSADAAPDQP